MSETSIKLQVTKEIDNCPKTVGAFDEQHSQFYTKKTFVMKSVVAFLSQNAVKRWIYEGFFVFAHPLSLNTARVSIYPNRYD